ncbi:MAG: DUF4230 domain-containing protein [Phaeodactylibacter sp.]|nr:DUF4230 domain-containing protein [Phaeodactylibacter sp.]MCB9050678.1 DUF4230 domain-containing protein [Lewinellaceae bacterium]
MAQRNYSSPNPTRSRNTLRAFLLIVALSLISIIIYKKFVSPPGYSNIPKELQLNYVPSDYQININEEDALAILSNPHRYRKEFNNLVYDINMSILYHVANRMNLSAEDKGKLQGEYEKHHPYLRNLYFHDFVALKDTTSQLYQTWYDNEGSNAIDVLREVASKYTCFLVTQIMTTLVPTQGGSIYAKGQSVDTPCGVAMQEALNPLMKRLEERAAIDDFSRSRGLLQEKVEKAIAELATMEVRDKKGLNKQLQTRVLGFAVSSSDIEVSAISILKVGFRLNEYFDISLNSKQGIVTITLPEPTILSHEVYPKIDKLDIGWLREVQGVDLNKNFNALRTEFRREALESDIMDKARANAIELMNTMFTPAIKGLNNRYNLRVQFRQMADSQEFSPENASTTYDYENRN